MLPLANCFAHVDLIMQELFVLVKEEDLALYDRASVELFLQLDSVLPLKVCPLLGVYFVFPLPSEVIFALAFLLELVAT
jgi:hypothetical protein